MKNSNLSKYALLFCAVFLCATSTIIFNPRPSLTEENKPGWGYGGAANPTQWSELSSEFEACEFGRDQSPININVVEKSEQSSEINFNYQESTGEVVNNGHTIQVDFEPGNTVDIDGEVYQLAQFHFHTPSEHTIENKSSAMELHLVHQNEAGQLAVVGVMMDSGSENETIASVWDAIPTGDLSAQGSAINIDPAELLPGDKTFLSYSGSLTTPPCSEQVKWNLMSEPIELSAEQIKTFESLYSYNARPVQPLNGRLIELHD